MALTKAYVQIYGQLPELFTRISEASAPDQFTTQHLKDWGYASSNYRAVIPLLKALGFLSANGAPISPGPAHQNPLIEQYLAEVGFIPTRFQASLLHTSVQRGLAFE